MSKPTESVAPVRFRYSSNVTHQLERSTGAAGDYVLLQRGVLGFSLFQHWNVGVGIFPEVEERLVSSLRSRFVSSHRVDSAHLQMR
jgi:hypothetical protein